MDRLNERAPLGRRYLSYAAARPGIHTGDLIAVRRSGDIVSGAIRTVTGAPYTHTGVAIWVGPAKTRRLLMAQVNEGGASLAPVSQLRDVAFDVFACPVDRDLAERAIWRSVGHPIDYDYVDLARIALHIRLGVPLPRQGKDFICSSLSAYIYQVAGWTPANLPSVPWPGAIVAALGTAPTLELRP